MGRHLRMTLSYLRSWEWRQAEGHENQSLPSWYAEQVGVTILGLVFIRAHKTGDTQTTRRLMRVFVAGRDAEQGDD